MNSIKNILSLLLFLTFFIAYIGKLIHLYKRDKIKANVLAKGHKVVMIKRTELFVKITTFIWGASWLILSLGDDRIISKLGILSDSLLKSLLGILFTFVGLLIFIQAMISMRTSWRVGIDKSTKTALVTQGIYKYSRNPAFVGFDFMFIGLFFMYPSLFTLAISILNLFSIHLLILQEEEHLKSVFGEDYTYYCRQTPRYLLFI